MKRFLIIALALVAGASASAQESHTWKRLESNFGFAGGMFFETGNNTNDPGIVLRTSYGLDIRLNEEWSVMPGAGLRAQMSDIMHIGWVGGDPDGMAAADVYISARYHSESDGARIVFGLGPALSYMVAPDTYYIDADPMDPMNGKEKFNRFDLGLQPSVTILRGRHFQWGVEANIGLLNALKQYYTYGWIGGKVHLHYIALSCGWHF